MLQGGFVVTNQKPPAERFIGERVSVWRHRFLDKFPVGEDTHLTATKSEFWKGARTVSPLLVGILPFAVIAGATAVGLSIPPHMAQAMSLFIFAGASQLVLLDLLDQNAPVLILILTALVVNSRFMMYSISMAPHFKGMGWASKALHSYLLTDQAFLVSIERFNGDDPKVLKRWYYLGCAWALFMTWQLGTAIGIFLGASAPEGLHLEFAVPLSFIALIVPAIKNRGTVIAALVAGTTILFTRHLPLNLGLLAATFTGMAAGWYFGKGDSK